MMEAVNTSEIFIYFYDTTRRNIPEGCQVYTRRCDNLKSHRSFSVVYIYIISFYRYSSVSRV
jgi:hypothetical protein